ncbi:hypothetical protein LDENG_00275140 [Lucifuga dentata]|nr:hypothetical protein LDENG_00275140 [Lucifuga dentata]
MAQFLAFCGSISCILWLNFLHFMAQFSRILWLNFLNLEFRGQISHNLWTHFSHFMEEVLTFDIPFLDTFFSIYGHISVI